MRDHGRTFKYGIFDKDGVLLDSLEMYFELFNEILERQHGKTVDLDEFKVFSMRPWHEVLLPLVGSEEELARFAKEYHKRTTQEQGKRRQMYPAVPGLLDALRNDHKLKLFVTSKSYQGAVDAMIKAEQLDGIFDLAFGNDGSRSVYKIEHFRKFAEHVGAPFDEFAKQSFLVEDMAAGLEEAKEAGIYAVGITTNHTHDELKAAGADVVIDDHRQLLDLL